MGLLPAIARTTVGAGLVLALLASAAGATTTTGGASPDGTATAASTAQDPAGGVAAPIYALRKLPSGVSRPRVAMLQTPDSVLATKTPRIRLRIVQKRVRHVTARIVVLRVPGGDPVARISLGRIRTGTTVKVRWPKDLRLAAGSYVIRVHAKDPRNHVLERTARAAGRAVMAVVDPAATTQPVVGATPVGGALGSTIATIPVTTTGVYPVQGAHTYGDRFGAPRNGYSHQGQDILGAEGTPIVAPLPGTITSTSYQASGAGYYVVQQTLDGRSLFFAHCQKDSTTVAVGQVVLAGTPICRMGRTGDATGTHLHLEIWENGWRASAASHPVDPMPQLVAWDHP